MGHPLGATGARQVATGYALARDNGGKVFVTSMCIGSGMVSFFCREGFIESLTSLQGMAAIFTNEQ
jgi:acetyl-CoA acetyltransferase